MKAHIGVDADSCLVHSVVGTAANVNDLNVAGALLHGEVEAALGGAGYLGVHKRPKADGPTWYVAMHPTLRRRLNPFIGTQFVAERVEETKTSICAEVEHPFRGAQAPVRLHEDALPRLFPRTPRKSPLFALSNLWMAQRQLMGAR